VDYDLPVLLDVTGQAAMTLGLPTVPRTVVFVDGRIVTVFGGVKPEFGQMLRNATPGWLGEGEGGSE
jgi:thioredoxin-like negative regulator of GroEL